MKEIKGKGIDGRLISFIIFILVSTTLSAQVTIHLNQNAVCNSFYYNDLWNVQLIHTGDEPSSVYLTIEIVSGNEDNGKEYLTIKSNVFSLQQGNNSSGIPDLNATFQYKDEPFRKAFTTTGMPPGNYYLCYILHSAQNDLETARACIFIKVKGTSGRLKRAIGKVAEFSGHAETEAFYNYRTFSPSNSSPGYLRLMFCPAIQIFDLPFSGSFVISTEKGMDIRSITKYTISYDYDRFINTVKQRAMDYLAEPEIPDVPFVKPDLSNPLKESLSIGSIMKNPKVIEELERLKELKMTKQLMSDSMFSLIGKIKNQQIISKLSGYKDFTLDSSQYRDTLACLRAYGDSLRVRYDRYYYLLKKEKGYLALIRKKQKIDSLLAGIQSNVQGINKENITHQINRYKEQEFSNKNNPTLQKIELIKHKLWDMYDKYLMLVNDLSIGTFLPYYSDLTLSGISLNGFNITLQPGKFYCRFSKGKMNFDSNPGNTFGYQYNRKLIAGSTGYGYMGQSNVRISFLTTDDEEGDNADTTLLHRKYHPVSNRVISVQGRLELFKKKIIIDAELAGSHTTGNNTNLSGGEFYVDSIPYNNTESGLSWIRDILTQKTQVMGTNVDYAFKATMAGSFFSDATRLSVTVGRTGPGYYSAGIPYLYSDRFNIETELGQLFFKKSSRLRVFCKYNHDNLDHNKLFTTTNITAGTSFNIKYRKLPSVTIGAMHINITNSVLKSRSTVINMMVAQHFKKRKVNHYISFMTTINHTTNNVNNRLIAGNFILNHLANLPRNLSLRSCITYSLGQNGDSLTDFLIGSMALSATLWKITSNSFGIKVFKSHSGMNYGLFFETYITINKYFAFRLSTSDNFALPYLFSGRGFNTKDLMVRGTLLFNW